MRLSAFRSSGVNIRPLPLESGSRMLIDSNIGCRKVYFRPRHGRPDILRHCLGGVAFNLDFDMVPCLCQELNKHVDTEAIDFAPNEVTNARLVDTK